MTWTRVCLTNAQVALGDDYRLQRKFTQQCAGDHRTSVVAMFSTAFLPGRPSILYFSPAVSAECPSFAAEVGAEACGKPDASVALRVGPIDARELLTGA